MMLNFVHFSVQEFLAAYYISQLPPNDELRFIKATFWSDIYFNMFYMYIALIKGQQPFFKKFLTGGSKTTGAISHKFLESQLKCFCLHCYLDEANDHAMCNTIEQALPSKSV